MNVEQTVVRKRSVWRHILPRQFDRNKFPVTPPRIVAGVSDYLGHGAACEGSHSQAALWATVRISSPIPRKEGGGNGGGFSGVLVSAGAALWIVKLCFCAGHGGRCETVGSSGLLH